MLALGESTIPAIQGRLFSSAKQIDLKSLQGGQPLVLAFFSVTCYPCRLEAPILNELKEQYQPQGVKFFYVNLDEEELRTRIPAFLRVTGILLPIFIPNVAEAYDRFLVSGLPYLLLYNAQGQEVYRHAGFDPGLKESLRQALNPLLR